MSFSVKEENAGIYISIKIVGETCDSVQDGINKYCISYNPLGYGTTFNNIILNEETGLWTVYGRRYKSCD